MSIVPFAGPGPVGFCLLAALAGATLAGCATESSIPSEQRYEAAVEAMRGSPDQQRGAVASCARSLDEQPATNRQNLASLADVPVDAAPQTVCDRVIQAMVEGRVDYRGVAAMNRGELTPDLVKAIQGR